MTTHIEIKWSVSRARDTYGYNICSLWEQYVNFVYSTELDNTSIS